MLFSNTLHEDCLYIKNWLKTEVWNSQSTFEICFSQPYRHRKGVEDATLTILNLIHTYLKKEKAMPEFYLLIFSIQYPPTLLTTVEAVTWLWVEPSLSHVDSWLFAWETSECMWMIVCPIQCIYPLVHIRVVSCLHCSSFYIQMIAGVVILFT